MAADRALSVSSLLLGLTLAALACGPSRTASGVDAATGGASVATGGASGGGNGGMAGNDHGSGGWGGRVAREPVHHRPAPVICEMNPAPTAATCSPIGNEGAAASTCTADAQCAEGANGRCIQYSVVETQVRCRCTYTECHGDQDCSTAGPCRCGGNAPNAWGNACLEGNCRVDGDCGPGGYCSPSRRRTALAAEADRPTSVAGYYCHTADDECLDDGDCLPAFGPTQCAYDESQRRWTCVIYPAL